VEYLCGALLKVSKVSFAFESEYCFVSFSRRLEFVVVVYVARLYKIVVFELLLVVVVVVAVVAKYERIVVVDEMVEIVAVKPNRIVVQ
jgi:hypothetical protein